MIGRIFFYNTLNFSIYLIKVFFISQQQTVEFPESVVFSIFSNLSFNITIEWSERYPVSISVSSKYHTKWYDRRKKLIYLALKKLVFAICNVYFLFCSLSKYPLTQALLSFGVVNVFIIITI